MTAEKLTRMPALQEQLGGISRVTIWRMRRRKEFPEPIAIGKNCVAWLQSDIDAWITARAQNRAA